MNNIYFQYNNYKSQDFTWDYFKIDNLLTIDEKDNIPFPIYSNYYLNRYTPPHKHKELMNKLKKKQEPEEEMDHIKKVLTSDSIISDDPIIS